VTGTLRKVKVEKIPLQTFSAAATGHVTENGSNPDAAVDCKPVVAATAGSMPVPQHIEEQSRYGDDTNYVQMPKVQEFRGQVAAAKSAGEEGCTTMVIAGMPLVAIENKLQSLKESDGISEVSRSMTIEQCGEDPVVGAGDGVVKLSAERSVRVVSMMDETPTQETTDLEKVNEVIDKTNVNRRHRVKVVTVPPVSGSKDDASCKTQ